MYTKGQLNIRHLIVQGSSVWLSVCWWDAVLKIQQFKPWVNSLNGKHVRLAKNFLWFCVTRPSWPVTAFKAWNYLKCPGGNFKGPIKCNHNAKRVFPVICRECPTIWNRIFLQSNYSCKENYVFIITSLFICFRREWRDCYPRQSKINDLLNRLHCVKIFWILCRMFLSNFSII